MSYCREIAAEEIKMQSCDCLAISSAPNTPILFAIRRIHLFGCAGSFHRWRGPPSSQRKAWRTKRIPRLSPVRSEKKETVFIPGCTPPSKCGRHVLFASLIEGEWQEQKRDPFLLPGCTPRRQSAGGVSALPKTGIAAVVISPLRRGLETFFV